MTSGAGAQSTYSGGSKAGCRFNLLDLLQNLSCPRKMLFLNTPQECEPPGVHRYRALDVGESLRLPARLHEHGSPPEDELVVLGNDDQRGVISLEGFLELFGGEIVVTL